MKIVIRKCNECNEENMVECNEENVALILMNIGKSDVTYKL